MTHNSDPTHPGKDFRKEIIDHYDLTLTAAAKLLNVSRKELSRIVNGRYSMTPNVCQRIAHVFGENAEDWAMRQTRYDLEKADQKVKQLNLKPYNPKP